MFPRIHPFTLDKWSSRSNVYSRHEPPNFASSASSRVTKNCPSATVFMKPALEHSLINSISSGRFAHFRSYSRSKFPCTFSLIRSGLVVVDNSTTTTTTTTDNTQQQQHTTTTLSEQSDNSTRGNNNNTHINNNNVQQLS